MATLTEMSTLAVLQHRHPCPGCGKVWTHRVQPICRAYNGEPLRCGLCQAAEQAPALADDAVSEGFFPPHLIAMKYPALRRLIDRSVR